MGRLRGNRSRECWRRLESHGWDLSRLVAQYCFQLKARDSSRKADMYTNRRPWVSYLTSTCFPAHRKSSLNCACACPQKIWESSPFTPPVLGVYVRPIPRPLLDLRMGARPFRHPPPIPLPLPTTVPSLPPILPPNLRDLLPLMPPLTQLHALETPIRRVDARERILVAAPVVVVLAAGGGQAGYLFDVGDSDVGGGTVEDAGDLF